MLIFHDLALNSRRAFFIVSMIFGQQRQAIHVQP